MSTARSLCFFCYIYPSIFPKNELIWHDEDHQCGHELAGWAEREYERFTLSWCPLTTWLRSCRSVETAKSTFLRNTEALKKELGDENFFQSVLTQGFTTDSSKLLFLHFMYSIQFSWFESKIFPLSRPYQIKTELILRK